ncbi:efflux transporter periplasmic adaptor subunit [Rhodoblastus sphagnicola]|uniref:Efflux transporter periplasmic adaptor subunit n=1 Tax=Rhodoblastus sphagnicola TaxID=333368 RepID=A0A2S6MVX1_9HYPH|nr:efflux RND transporter periplasmic adaptor subunit [Rhodoblastus sphagnicola]MBB4197550.1 membrane fusion protein (multidrug efflux system) [Rhodoblastus sphagnicola]PPQ26488.1 efflux transporter periplasmic adaptor subunit [Rhodoblastus sphagnicola]
MSPRKSWRSSVIPTVTSCLILALCGCKPSAKDPVAETPSAEVSIVAAKAVAASRTVDLPGRLASTRVAEVRAQVSGIIQERAFKEGAQVAEGDVLFRIDPSIYQAEVDAKAAAVARAEANRIQAVKQAERADALLEKRAASTAQHDIATAMLQQAEADVASAKAQLARARIDLDHATVRAPIAGRIGRALVTEGALAQGDATRLAVIQQIDPIYADFSADASEIGLLMDRAATNEPIEVRLVRDDGAPRPGAGELLFSDVSVDAGTGQVSLRAAFANPNGALLPGAYVRVRVPFGVAAGAVIVPAQAIQRSSAGEAQAYVVGENKTLALRPLRTGALTDAGWIVEDGLKPGETVVVEGFQRIQPGMPVTSKPWRDAPAAVSAKP